ncbi:MAG TPA: hypothetical protein PKH94_10470 [Bacteroidales bacterium]|nr:hypothetical protein [Bacteroidales bacterium]
MVRWFREALNWLAMEAAFSDSLLPVTRARQWMAREAEQMYFFLPPVQNGSG